MDPLEAEVNRQRLRREFERNQAQWEYRMIKDNERMELQEMMLLIDRFKNLRPSEVDVEDLVFILALLRIFSATYKSMEPYVKCPSWVPNKVNQVEQDIGRRSQEQAQKEIDLLEDRMKDERPAEVRHAEYKDRIKDLQEKFGLKRFGPDAGLLPAPQTEEEKPKPRKKTSS